jgi:hypothetical protein
MAYTTEQLAALEEAIASGVLTVRHRDGRSVTYNSLSDMRSLRQQMKRELDVAAGSRRRRTFRLYQKGKGI